MMMMMMMAITATTITMNHHYDDYDYHGSHIDLHIESPPTWHFENTQPCTGVWESSVDIKIMESSGISWGRFDEMD